MSVCANDDDDDHHHHHDERVTVRVSRSDTLQTARHSRQMTDRYYKGGVTIGYNDTHNSDSDDDDYVVVVVVVVVTVVLTPPME